MISDDYFFDIAPSPSQPTVLYGLQPRGAGTGSIESLDSYIVRLAKAHVVAARSLLDNVLSKELGGTPYRSAWSNCRAAAWAALGGTGELGRHWVTILERLTGRSDIRGMTVGWMDKVIASHGLIDPPGRYCPECIKNDVAGASEPFNRLLWRIKLVTACPLHGVTLRRRHCLNAEHSKINNFMRALSAGYCSTCGQVLYRCDPSSTARASKEELWIASQLSELLAFGSKGGELEREALVTGIKELAELVSEGHPVTLAKRSGLAKSIVVTFLNKRHTRISMSAVLALCGSTGCNVLSLLAGAPVIGEPVAISLPKKEAQKQIDYRRGEALLKEAISRAGAGLSMEAIAREIGARSSRSLRKAFPDLCAQLGHIHRSRQATLREERIQATVVECERMLALLAEQQLRPTLRNLEKVTGKRPTSDSPLAKAFFERRQSPRPPANNADPDKANRGRLCTKA